MYLILAVVGGIQVKSAHTLENLDQLAQAGGAGLQPVAAVSGQRFLVVVSQLTIPIEYHKGAGHAAAPLAGLLLRFEVAEDGQGVAGLQMIEIQGVKIRASLVVALALHTVRPILRAQIAGIGNLHLVGVVATACLLPVSTGSQEKRAHRNHKGPYN